MSDMELLEFAAKACKIGNCDRVDIDGSRLFFDPNDRECESYTRWNPLANDADAFRLAASLHMTVSFGPMESHASTISGSLRGNHFMEKHIDHMMSVESATRRAIVNAAAEVGRNS